MPINRDDLTQFMNGLLSIEQFDDYGPNGLQVEGKAEIKKIVYGVTASLALIEQAIQQKADAIVVHHGLFWRGQDGRVVGWMKERLKKLLTNDINLYGYHLPLDAHPAIGNNAVLGDKLGLKVDAFVGQPAIVAIGHFKDKKEQTLAELTQQIEAVVGKQVLAIAGHDRPLRKIGWCTGGAQDYFEQAIAAGVDVYITGEISEPQAHYAREMGVSYIAAGHHATERYGIQTLAEKVREKFSVEGQYIEIDNPA